VRPRSGRARRRRWTGRSITSISLEVFSPLDQINTTNVKSLTPRWLFQYGIIDGVSNQTTPVVVDDIMYVTDPRGSVYAVNAVDGHLLWSYDGGDPGLQDSALFLGIKRLKYPADPPDDLLRR
jgi:glucose dehydrogenase